MNVAVRARLDVRALVSALLAVVAVLTAQVWIVATLAALASIGSALLSRKAVREQPHLRGTILSLSGFLISVGVLVFATVGPSMLGMFLFALAPA